MIVRPLTVVLVTAALFGAAALTLAQQRARPTGSLDPTGCTVSGCHPDVKRFDVIHGPVSVDACDACHRLVDEAQHIYEPARSSTDLCTFCHDMQLDGAAVIHEPLNTGDCTGCHDPHGGPSRKMLKAPTVNDLCKNCHEDVVGSMRQVHGPVAAGACSACHSPHASAHRGLLSATGPELCVGCHASMGTHLETMRSVHEPVKGGCQQCHDPHATNHPMMLINEPQALCMSCHETIRHTIETAATQHAAVTTEQACLHCHEAHASDFPRVLRDEMTTLCFECHDREIKLEDGTTLGDIKAVIESGMSLHGPVAQNDCAACHMIHGGDNFRLLVQEYPPEFYAPFREESYALCFSCHDQQLVHDARTTSLTDFRNGDLNLHYLHVNREKKGRTCRACHETHASNQANFIRESVPFGPGGWELPIRFEQLETGGRCAPGCHVAYGYDRVEPVEYPAEGSPAVWPQAGDPKPAPADTTGGSP